MSESDAPELTYNLKKLRFDLQALKSKEYTWDDIAQQAGLHPQTLYGIASNRSKRVDMTTLFKLWRFFNAEGLTIGIGDLFTIENREEATS